MQTLHWPCILEKKYIIIDRSVRGSPWFIFSFMSWLPLEIFINCIIIYNAMIGPFFFFSYGLLILTLTVFHMIGASGWLTQKVPAKFRCFCNCGLRFLWFLPCRFKWMGKFSPLRVRMWVRFLLVGRRKFGFHDVVGADVSVYVSTKILS